ncbi:2-hydroxyacid dehydrogenase [Polyangium jinanense]|uniref:2-hydroxyacid dehydrogenase n=1 Tax=Polyangium jinanense TaxID=2829994 RepID=A0A9X3XHI1_9BACT|nr:2-hydroxyacid dehydrogenase [Polyangium jinanense]MDC3958826.1 2-hydroxyacid dehydrogenase [Polyangium jinanense]MDC3989188.1 2-hydroxyacid dehydrogenase [Polyangium jinanense]
MKVSVFDTHRYERDILAASAARRGHELVFLEPRLTEETAVLAQGTRVACSFVNDHVTARALETLAAVGVGLIALRSAGYNHVDLQAAARLGLPVVRVPEYSPHAVAEHAAALILALNRKIHKAYARVREGNFSLEGLVGFDMVGKTAGVIGTGRIGAALARILHGFGCHVLAYDLRPDATLVDGGIVRYTTLAELYAKADILSLHVPLTPETHHLVDAAAIAAMKRGVMLINTGRGALVDTPALLEALKTGQVGHAGLDVYEEEEGIFFQDLSDRVIQDDVLARLLTLPNVLVTSHQGFLTHEALTNIAETTFESVSAFERGEPLLHALRVETVIRS